MFVAPGICGTRLWTAFQYIPALLCRSTGFIRVRTIPKPVVYRRASCYFLNPSTEGNGFEMMRYSLFALIAAAVVSTASIALSHRRAPAADAPFLASELIFPLEHWHNHASMVGVAGRR